MKEEEIQTTRRRGEPCRGGGGGVDIGKGKRVGDIRKKKPVEADHPKVALGPTIKGRSSRMGMLGERGRNPEWVSRVLLRNHAAGSGEEAQPYREKGKKGRYREVSLINMIGCFQGKTKCLEKGNKKPAERAPRKRGVWAKGRETEAESRQNRASRQGKKNRRVTKKKRLEKRKDLG